MVIFTTTLAPRWLAQDGSKMTQDGSKMAQDGSKMAQDGPKMVQDGPKMAPRGPTCKVKAETGFKFGSTAVHDRGDECGDARYNLKRGVDDDNDADDDDDEEVI